MAGDAEIRVIVRAVLDEFSSKMESASNTVAESSRKMAEASADSHTQVREGAESAGEAMRAFGEKAEEAGNLAARAFPQAAGAIELLTSPLAGATALVGAFIATVKEAVEGTRELTHEVDTLARRMGLSSEQASALNSALEAVGGSSEVFASAFTRFTRQLETHADRLKLVGINYEEMKKKGMSSLEMFDAALERLKEYKAGHDQTVVSMALFGRNVQDIIPLLKLQKDALEEAAEENEKLGSAVTDADRALNDQLTRTAAGVREVFKGFSLQLSREITPLLIQMGEWFKTVGPDAMATLARGVANLAQFFVGFGSAAAAAFDTVRTGLHELVGLFVAAYATLDQLLRGNLDGAKEVWSAYFDDVQSQGRRWADNMQSIFATASAAARQLGADLKLGTADAIAAAAQAGALGNTLIKTSGSLAAPPGLLGGKHARAGGENALARAQAAVRKAEAEAELSDIKASLRDAQFAYDEAFKLGELTLKEYYAARLAITERAIEAELTAKRREMSALQAEEKSVHGKGADAKRLEIKAQEIRLNEQIVLLERQRTQAAIENAAKFEEAERKQQLALTQTADAEQRVLVQQRQARENILAELQLSRGETTKAQIVELKRREEQELYSLELKGLQDRLALEQGDVAKRAAISAQIEELYAKHQTKLTELDVEAIKEREQYEEEAIKGVEDAFGRLTESLVSNIGDWKKALLTFITDVGRALEQAYFKQFMDQLKSGDFGSGLRNLADKIFGGGATPGAGVAGAASDQAAAAATQAMAAADQAAATSGQALATADQTAATSSQAFTTALQAASTALQQFASALSQATFGRGGGGGFGGGGLGDLFGLGGGEDILPGFGGADLGFGAADLAAGGNLADMLTYIPLFAEGTNYVPHDMLALVHQGEAIIPAKFNTPGGAVGGNSTVVNNFAITGPVDTRTQQQIAQMVGQAVGRALSRGG